jgi:Arc/MetJ family transcription regulator
MLSEAHHDASLVSVRTTITLADDVAAAVERLQRERGKGISDAVNELVRRGLTAPTAAHPFAQTTAALGVPALPLDDVAGLLEVLDGPAER